MLPVSEPKGSIGNVSVIKPQAILMTPYAQIRSMPQLIERCARTCYKSEDRITEESAASMIKSLIQRGHESVLEHCSLTIRFVGSRAMSHQLVRHRIGAYSQESMRYVNYNKTGSVQIICPPAIENSEEAYSIWWTTMLVAVRDYKKLVLAGIKPEDARFVLPNGTKTEVCTTFNIRQWRHVFRERAFNDHAQWEIKLVMQQAFSLLVTLVPCLFEDLRPDGFTPCSILDEIPK